MLKSVDALLNRFTMYTVVLYGLLALLGIADILAWVGVLPIGPLGLLISVLLLVATCYVANEAFGRLFHAARNKESYLITALILACILPPVDSLQRAALVVLTGALAMASKYILVWRGSHFLNPAAFAAFVVSVTGLLPVTWWIANPSLFIPAALLAFVVLRKQRKFQLFAVFAACALALLLYIGVVFGDQSVWEVFKNAWLSWPIIFMGSIMLTEPSTLPPTRYYQMLVAVLVGILFACQLHFGPVATTPQFALLMGNILTVLAVPTLGTLLRLKRVTRLAPATYDLAFEPTDRKITFVPGQYLEWTLPHAKADMRGNRRVFSIASSPAEPDIHIGTKVYEPGSTFKRALLGMKPGSYIRVAHLAGNFTLPEQLDTPLIFIAGGIGITPFRSMVQYLVDTGQKRDITLLYSARSEQDFVYDDVFQTAAANGVRVLYHTDRLDAAHLKATLPGIDRSLIYISGPDAMVSSHKSMLRSLGVPAKRIKTDHFSGY